MSLSIKSARSTGLRAHEILLTPSIFRCGLRCFLITKMGENHKNEV